MTPSVAGTLADALEDAAPVGAEFVFHLRDGVVRVTASMLLEEARAGATFLADRGVGPGDAVGILGPNGPEWVRWAYATWLAGAALVPLPYHLRIRDSEAFRGQVDALLRTARCRVVLADPRFLPHLPPGVGLAWDEEAPRTARALRSPEPEDVAVVQFTSGSTAAPKGAILTHRAVLAGVRNSAAAPGPDLRGWTQLSWLPFFHDWGLFGFLVWPVVVGTETHILPTERFAKDPSEWLRLAGRVGAMITPGPTSAWDAALRVASRRREGIDLSTLRICSLAAEAIEPRVLDRLLELGGEFGLRPEAPGGGYGMAESTLAVTVEPADRPVRVDAIDRAALVTEGRAAPAAEGPAAKRIVSSGAPVPGAKVRIAGPDGDAPERGIGQILLQGPSLMSGYLGDEHESPFDHGWLQTGDLGYLAEGELFVTGRIKDVVIVMGRNYPAQDLEWAAERVDGVRLGRTVAFGTEEAEGEAVVVVEPAKGDDVEDLPRVVWRAVGDALGIVPREIVVVPAGTIPMTTSGKLRRSWVRRSYATGDLDGLALARGPGHVGSVLGDLHPSHGEGES